MIRLIKQDQEQKKWALVIQGPVPTIEAYKRNPHMFNALIHGLYEFECDMKNLRSDGNGIRCWLEGFGGRDAPVIKVLASQIEIIKNLALGNVQYNKPTVSFRGRFDKRGSEILFILGDE